MNAISPLSPITSSSYLDITGYEGQIVSLDDRLIEAFSNNAVRIGQEQTSILSQLDRPAELSDPAVLFELQQRTANYNLEVSMISTLTRKAVGAVETLLRS